MHEIATTRMPSLFFIPLGPDIPKLSSPDPEKNFGQLWVSRTMVSEKKTVSLSRWTRVANKKFDFFFFSFIIKAYNSAYNIILLQQHHFYNICYVPCSDDQKNDCYWSSTSSSVSCYVGRCFGFRICFALSILHGW